LQLCQRFRIPAIFCALAVLVCELISRPFANMGICDDGPYIRVAQKLAATGHIFYNGWSAAMLIWQLYLGAAFIKLFGFSFTTVRSSTLLVSLALAFFLQRTLVRAGITERNATIGTLALVLSPLYLLLSVTFMSDIHGLFAIVLCLYGCLRALQSATSRAAIGWLAFAVATNAICGTSRQLAWLGILVLLPSTLWLLRARRRVLLAGTAVTLTGVLFILGCMQWLKHQPYTLSESLHISSVPFASLGRPFLLFFLDIPFLLLPIVVLFLPQIRKSDLRVLPIVTAASVVYALVALHLKHLLSMFLEPTAADWFTKVGGYQYLPQGMPPIFLHTWMQALLTFAMFGGLAGLIASLIPSRRMSPVKGPSPGVSWNELGVLFAPFAIAYTLLLFCRAASIAGDSNNIIYGYQVVLDRYALGLLVVALLCLVRFYQDRVQPRLPLAGTLFVGLTAICGIAVTHNMFAFYRARVALADEFHSAGIPETAVDNGWEYNMLVELKYADHINDSEIEFPVGGYIPITPPPASKCPMGWYDKTPHIKPAYGISFDPNACYGPAPFAPIHYSRWLAGAPGTIYAVRYTNYSKP
jgi:hypothetical protein